MHQQPTSDDTDDRGARERIYVAPRITKKRIECENNEQKEMRARARQFIVELERGPGERLLVSTRRSGRQPNAPARHLALKFLKSLAELLLKERLLVNYPVAVDRVDDRKIEEIKQ